MLIDPAFCQPVDSNQVCGRATISRSYVAGTLERNAASSSSRHPGKLGPVEK